MGIIESFDYQNKQNNGIRHSGVFIKSKLIKLFEKCVCYRFIKKKHNLISINICQTI